MNGRSGRRLVPVAAALGSLAVRQRAQIARALAQAPRELLLDEPTNHLDIRHQLETLTLLRQLGLTTVVVLHDLNLAVQFCDDVAVLHRGRLLATGRPAAVLTAPLIRDVFGVHATVERQHLRFSLLPAQG